MRTVGDGDTNLPGADEAEFTACLPVPPALLSDVWAMTLAEQPSSKAVARVKILLVFMRGSHVGGDVGLTGCRIERSSPPAGGYSSNTRLKIVSTCLKW